MPRQKRQNLKAKTKATLDKSITEVLARERTDSADVTQLFYRPGLHFAVASRLV